MECVFRKHLQGMTLVELLISLVLSSILAIMMFNTIYLLKRSVLTQQALVRLQVNARALDYLLGKALRNSGVFGCHKLHFHSVISVEQDIHLPHYGLLHSKGILGIAPHQLPTDYFGTDRVLKRCKNDSELLWIQSSHNTFSMPRLKNGSILVMSDCSRLSLFRKRDNKVPIVQEPLSLSVLSSTIYYVGDTHRKNSKGSDIYALYSTDFNGRTLELIEGVEKIEIAYGRFINGELVYQKAQEVSDWYAIVSVRLKALLNTIEETEPVIKKWWYYEWPLM